MYSFAKFWECHVSRIMQHVAIWIWLLSQMQWDDTFKIHVNFRMHLSFILVLLWLTSSFALHLRFSAIGLFCAQCELIWVLFSLMFPHLLRFVVWTLLSSPTSCFLLEHIIKWKKNLNEICILFFLALVPVLLNVEVKKLRCHSINIL